MGVPEGLRAGAGRVVEAGSRPDQRRRGGDRVTPRDEAQDLQVRLARLHAGDREEAIRLICTAAPDAVRLALDTIEPRARERGFPGAGEAHQDRGKHRRPKVA